MKCRFCKSNNKDTILDLHFSPPSNSYLAKEDLSKPELYFPLRLFKCKSCSLVQTFDIASEKIFFSKSYAYLSSTSKTWLNHAKDYVEKMISELSLCKTDLVIEIASNDGYLLKNFIKYKIPAIGIEPTLSTAKIARKNGIKTITKFFTQHFATDFLKNNKKAKLIVANNVLAHVPDINDFVKAIKILLANNGVCTIEFPHLLNLILKNQFDTIYHEHFSYLSLKVVNQLFTKNKLKVFNVEKIDTHGGSLRVFVCHDNYEIKINRSISAILNQEKMARLTNLKTYTNLIQSIYDTKYSLLSFLLKAKKENKKVIGYGAAAKANTILNFFGIKNDLIEYIFDNSKYKFNKFMPGNHIPIIKSSKINDYSFDYVIIFPWNIKDEIISFFKKTNRNNNYRFILLVPNFKIL